MGGKPEINGRQEKRAGKAPRPFATFERWCGDGRKSRSLTPAAKDADGFGMTMVVVDATADEAKAAALPFSSFTVKRPRRYIYTFTVARRRMRGGANAAERAPIAR